MTHPDKFKFPLKSLIECANIADLIKDKTKLANLGRDAVANYKKDKRSRAQWEQRTDKAIKMALQVSEIKNFPWENCSNVKFPLLTIAALQFLARISVMTKGRTLAKVEALGVDADGEK